MIPENYVAFISYRHICNEVAQDADYAKDLQDFLQGYELPRSLSKKFPRCATTIRPVFRDTELRKGDRLTESIRTALRASSFLIVVCTPNIFLKQKEDDIDWISREIEFFLQEHNGDETRILPVVYRRKEDRPQDFLPQGVKDTLAFEVVEGQYELTYCELVAKLLSIPLEELQPYFECPNRSVSANAAVSLPKHKKGLPIMRMLRLAGIRAKRVAKKETPEMKRRWKIVLNFCRGLILTLFFVFVGFALLNSRIPLNGMNGLIRAGVYPEIMQNHPYKNFIQTYGLQGMMQKGEFYSEESLMSFLNDIKGELDEEMVCRIISDLNEKYLCEGYMDFLLSYNQSGNTILHVMARNMTRQGMQWDVDVVTKLTQMFWNNGVRFPLNEEGEDPRVVAVKHNNSWYLQFLLEKTGNEIKESEVSLLKSIAMEKKHLECCLVLSKYDAIQNHDENFSFLLRDLGKSLDYYAQMMTKSPNAVQISHFDKGANWNMEELKGALNALMQVQDNEKDVLCANVICGLYGLLFNQYEYAEACFNYLKVHYKVTLERKNEVSQLRMPMGPMVEIDGLCESLIKLPYLSDKEKNKLIKYFAVSSFCSGKYGEASGWMDVYMKRVGRTSEALYIKALSVWMSEKNIAEVRNLCMEALMHSDISEEICSHIAWLVGEMELSKRVECSPANALACLNEALSSRSIQVFKRLVYSRVRAMKKCPLRTKLINRHHEGVNVCLFDVKMSDMLIGTGMRAHIVQKFDTLASIADRYSIDVALLKKMNDGLQEEQLREGLVVRIN